MRRTKKKTRSMDWGTMTRIARKLGYTPQYVSMVVSGKRNNAVISDAITAAKRQKGRQTGRQLRLPFDNQEEK